MARLGEGRGVISDGGDDFVLETANARFCLRDLLAVVMFRMTHVQNVLDSSVRHYRCLSMRPVLCIPKPNSHVATIMIPLPLPPQAHTPSSRLHLLPPALPPQPHRLHGRNPTATIPLPLPSSRLRHQRLQHPPLLHTLPQSPSQLLLLVPKRPDPQPIQYPPQRLVRHAPLRGQRTAAEVCEFGHGVAGSFGRVGMVVQTGGGGQLAGEVGGQEVAAEGEADGGCGEGGLGGVVGGGEVGGGVGGGEGGHPGELGGVGGEGGEVFGVEV